MMRYFGSGLTNLPKLRRVSQRFPEPATKGSERTLTALQDFGSIASALGLLKADEETNTVVQREVAKGWLADPKKMVIGDDGVLRQQDAKWLMIFDNADDPELLEEYWVVFGSGSILMTSRNPLTRTTLSEAVCVNLKSWNEQTGASFLRRLAYRADEEDVSVEISRHLGGVSIAHRYWKHSKHVRRASIR